MRSISVPYAIPYYTLPNHDILITVLFSQLGEITDI